MGLLDGVLGGVVGAEMTTVVERLIQQHGGVQGIVQQMEQQGLGPTVRSWISNGPNQPISPGQVQQTFPQLGDLAAKFGLNTHDLAAKLSQVLPHAIDRMTPNGAVPQA